MNPSITNPVPQSRFFSLCLTLWIGLVCAPAALTAQEKTSSMKSVERLLQKQDWPKAMKALEKITLAEPENGAAWFYLSYSHHNMGDFEKALQVGSKAVDFPAYRATMLYNMACASSMLERTAKASEYLLQAQEAGFLDFDTMESDAELSNLRAAEGIQMPSKHVYQNLKGRNGVIIPYIVLLPEDYSAEKEYSVAVSFAPESGGKRTTDWTIDNLWTDQPTRSDWIVVCAVAPTRGWMTHPSHHALEDLFKRLSKDYDVIHNRFHLVGFGSGADVATTYSSMSRKYTASLTVASGDSFDGWDKSDFKRVGAEVHQIVSAKVLDQWEKAKVVHASIQEYSENLSLLTVLEDEGILLPSLHGGRILDYVAKDFAENNQRERRSDQ